MGTNINDTTIITDTLKFSSPYVPATPTSAGTEGQLAWDENFIYICIADNNWARTNISTGW